jgi:transposase
MRRHLYLLSDEEWAAIQPHLPTGRQGARRVDDRRVISGIVHMLKTGARWRDCPAEYGPYTTIYNRFNRWSKQGVWEDVFYVLSGSSGVIGTTSADSSSIKAHRSASGGKGGSSLKPSGDLAADGRPRFMP